jgi:hypothetical protein
MIYAVYKTDFTEYEAGWGQRPDGYTLATTKEKAIKHKAEYEANGSYELYFRGDEPRLIEVSKEVYDIVKKDGLIWDVGIKKLGLKL